MLIKVSFILDLFLANRTICKANVTTFFAIVFYFSLSDYKKENVNREIIFKEAYRQNIVCVVIKNEYVQD